MSGSQRIAWILVAATAATAACTSPSDERKPAPGRPTAAAVVDAAAQAAPPAAPAPPAPQVQDAVSAPSGTQVAAALPPAPIAVPPDALYVCVSEVAGERRQSTIEYSPEVAKLCRKNPEMGPCQYERAACRRSGGRVFAANGSEITAATEAEYNRRVMRVHLRSD